MGLCIGIKVGEHVFIGPEALRLTVARTASGGLSLRFDDAPGVVVTRGTLGIDTHREKLAEAAR